VAIEKVREHLANERTFLAWVRTALGLIGLGFVRARMGLFLRQIAATAAAGGFEAGLPGRGPHLHTGREFLITGVVFLVIGTTIGGLAAWLYERNRRAIVAEQFEPDLRPVIGLTVVVVLGGAIVIGLVLWRVMGEG
jgi:putative membrane protein